MRIAIITAGGAGMFCGSCMHDNTWTKALRGAGADVSLLPAYTPIRVDEQNQSDHRVFLGGINLYLDHHSRTWQRLPRFLKSWLDRPAILRFASKLGVSNDAAKLGALTLAMLAGEHGPMREGIETLTEFLVTHEKPDVIVFSNALMVGVLHHLRSRFDGTILCMLQGDDVFLDALPDEYRERAIGSISERAADFDGYLTHSGYYRAFMAEYLSLPIERFRTIPLGIDFDGHSGTPRPAIDDQFTIGSLARICPEKGTQNLFPAFRLLHRRHPHTRLRLAGYLDPRYRKWLRRHLQSVADLGAGVEFVGSPGTHAEKVAFLNSLDLFSVPTDYHEPKGLPVLEAWANGVPVVQPAHGAFPELIAATGGGVLVPPGDPEALAAAWERLLIDDTTRLRHATDGHTGVRRVYGADELARQTLTVFEEFRSGLPITTEPERTDAATEPTSESV